eukprot:3269529-Rhodomonas_salina.1
MQSEDDKAKAAGIAVGVVGLIFSKFSILVGILAGGAAVYSGKLPSRNYSLTAQQQWSGAEYWHAAAQGAGCAGLYVIVYMFWANFSGLCGRE